MLSDRKLKILEAIVRGYVQTAEPVGSRTIEKKHNIGISSATIRNEMSDLEEMGLILKPHTSAGSIPSEKGYRIFVDEIAKMNTKGNSKNDSELELFSQIISKNIEHIDYLMRETAKMISDVTNGITVITEPKSEQIKILSVSFAPIDNYSCVVVVVTEDKKVANKTINFDSEIVIHPETLFKLGTTFTDELKGLNVSEISNDHYVSLRNKIIITESLLAKVMSAIVEMLNERNNYEVYTYGKENIFSLPDFDDATKAIELFKTLEERQMLLSILGENNENVQVLIGSENSLEQMKNCSIVRKGYSLGNNTGCIGVIGPTRMEYEKTISTLNYVVEHLRNIDLYNDF